MQQKLYIYICQSDLQFRIEEADGIGLSPVTSYSDVYDLIFGDSGRVWF
jgi:hypothetical protein